MARFIHVASSILVVSLLFCGHLFAQQNNASPDEPEKASTDAAPGEKKPENGKNSKKDYEIIITATKTGIKKKETGSSVTVITGEEIEQSKKTSLVDLLKSTPGIAVSQSGSLGGLADLYIRGSNSNHVMVLIDGVKVNDPASAGHGFDFSNLTTDNIEQVEIIRGSQSVLYGSDAIGGVINIITRKGSGKPKITLQAEGGSFYTFKESAGVSGGEDWANYSINLSRLDSRGFNRTSTWRGIGKTFLRNRHDPYNNTAVSTSLGLKTFHEGWLTFSLRFTDAHAQINNGAYEEDINHTFDNQNLAFNVMYTVPVFEWWEPALLFSYMHQYMRDKNKPDIYEYTRSLLESDDYASVSYTNMTFKGRMMSGEFRNTFKIKDIDEIICGISYEGENASTNPYYFGWMPRQPMAPLPYSNPWYMQPTDPIDENQDAFAVYAQNHLKLFKRLFIIAGIRYTQPEHFKYSIDYAVSGSFIVPVSETRFKASIGTGFKTPSLYQQYNVFERYDRYTFSYLKPERTVSYDVGVEQPIWDNRIVVELNYFSIDYRNLIVYDTTLDSWGRYWNSKALSRGAECILSFRPIDDLRISGYYTYTRSLDKTFQSGDMVRRPRHQAGVAANYSFLGKGNINADFRYVGERRDYWQYPFVSYMKPYYRFDMAASWWIIKQLQAFFRVENILNRKYDEIRGYRMPGVSFYGGIKAVL